MTAGSLDIVIEQGATFTREITIRDDGAYRSLVGYSAAMDIRQEYDSATALVSLSSPSSGIVFDTGATPNTLTLTITTAQTAALSFTQAARWDLVLTAPDDSKERLLKGSVTLSLGVTQ